MLDVWPTAAARAQHDHRCPAVQRVDQRGGAPPLLVARATAEFAM